MKNPKLDYLQKTGIIFVAISSILSLLENIYVQYSSDLFTGLFFIHYTIAVIFGIISIFKYKISFFKFFTQKVFVSHTILLILFNICAYSLNKSIPIFQESVDWLSYFIIIENLILLIYAFANKSNQFINCLTAFLLGIAILFHLYQCYIVLPTVIIGIIGIILFGISLLLFVPLFYVGCFIAIARRITWNKINFISFSVGISIPLIIIGFILTQWVLLENKLNDTKLTIDQPFKTQIYPEWIVLAQQIGKNRFSEAYLKTGIVYQNMEQEWDMPFNMDLNDFSQKKLNDPLYAVCSVFMNSNNINYQTKIKVLNYLYDARHESADRLWSGANLKSTRVITNVEVFPKERLSFTELIISIANRNGQNGSRWGNQQEAFYTFQLPEGGVVTSLSLWIEGQEEKAILTTKKKAKKAYETIVGKERRDPSVVYWMEGNQIRVRVFPCTPSEERKFKIGVTAPLSLIDNQLAYKAITFKGPDYSAASAAINLVLNGSQVTSSTLSFKQNVALKVWKGSYKPSWTFTIDAPPISNGSFSFGKERFTLEEESLKYNYIQPKQIYLDLNSQWNKKELESIVNEIKEEKLFIYHDGLISISKEDLNNIDLSELPLFTLFPFYELPDHEETIVITKGNVLTPNLSDLNGSKFGDRLFSSFSNNTKIAKVYDLTGEPSNYIRSLKELEVIEYQSLNLNKLINNLRSNQFPTIIKDPKKVNIPNAGITIVKSAPQLTPNKASDHLLRLFNYQKVMSGIGSSYFTMDQNNYLEDGLIEFANTANIVTPLSSLIVLETQKDYERFDIHRNKDSLGNASIGNAGAAPEPHEWALIGIGLCFIIFMYRKKLLNNYSIK